LRWKKRLVRTRDELGANIMEVKPGFLRKEGPGELDRSYVRVQGESDFQRKKIGREGVYRSDT
jgi:hypothetical protein